MRSSTCSAATSMAEVTSSLAETAHAKGDVRELSAKARDAGSTL